MASFAGAGYFGGGGTIGLAMIWGHLSPADALSRALRLLEWRRQQSPTLRAGTMISQRPLPEITPLTQPFWDAAKLHELVVQRRDDCGTYRLPPAIGYYACSSLRSSWVRVSGRATLYTWTVAYPPLLPYFEERGPWPVAVVQLEEGLAW